MLSRATGTCTRGVAVSAAAGGPIGEHPVMFRQGDHGHFEHAGGLAKGCKPPLSAITPIVQPSVLTKHRAGWRCIIAPPRHVPACAATAGRCCRTAHASGGSRELCTRLDHSSRTPIARKRPRTDMLTCCCSDRDTMDAIASFSALRLSRCSPWSDLLN